MNDTGHTFFSRQLSLQKRGLLLFPLAVSFMAAMIYFRSGRQLQLYAIPIPLLILVSAFIVAPLAGASVCRKTIVSYELLTNNTIRFTCYNPLWSVSRVYEVNARYLQQTSNAAIGKKNIYRIDPSIRITDIQTRQLFYYFPVYFDDNSCLTQNLEQA